MITLRRVFKVYDTRTQTPIRALSDISLEIQEGELVVLQGPSGSGKSTLLSLIAALSKPTSGDIFIEGKQISKLPEHFASRYRREHIGFIFQRYNLIANLSVRENIAVGLIPLNLPRRVLNEKIIQSAQKFHIDHKLDAIVRNLSGGEQQRVAIARANVNDPKIILADEPTANLDQSLSNRFIDVLAEFKAQGKTVIVATHDPIFDLPFVDRFVTIKHGKIQ